MLYKCFCMSTSTLEPLPSLCTLPANQRAGVENLFGCFQEIMDLKKEPIEKFSVPLFHVMVTHNVNPP